MLYRDTPVVALKIYRCICTSIYMYVTDSTATTTATTATTTTGTATMAATRLLEQQLAHRRRVGAARRGGDVERPHVADLARVAKW